MSSSYLQLGFSVCLVPFSSIGEVGVSVTALLCLSQQGHSLLNTSEGDDDYENISDLMIDEYQIVIDI